MKMRHNLMLTFGDIDISRTDKQQNKHKCVFWVFSFPQIGKRTCYGNKNLKTDQYIEKQTNKKKTCRFL